MKRALSTLVLACTAVCMQTALAADSTKAHDQTPKVVSGVTLSTLCDGCGVVSKTRTETRKGKASGVGAVGGAVAGGVVGHQLGGGGGKTALTVLGAVGGGLAGNAVEKNMKKYTVWITTVTYKDGTKKTFEGTSNPALRAGDVVVIRNGHPVRKAS